MSVTLRYFAWVRERIGKTDETVDLPATVATVGQLIDWLIARGEEYAHAFENRKVIRAAIDKTHVQPDASITSAREIAFFPPMTGGLMTPTVRIQPEKFDAAAESAKLTRGRTDIGAVVTFTGLCRGDESGEPITALTLEHYPGMVEDEIGAHAREAAKRWPLLGLTVVHRYGRILPGEEIVLVVAASAHRQAAFDAANFLMDFLKTRAPFWKQVESSTGNDWVEAKQIDDQAAERWRYPYNETEK